MGASGSSDVGAAQPAPPPIPSHPAGTEPAAPNQPPAAPSSSADHLDSVLQGVEKIRVLETEHEAKLALLAAKRKEVANLQEQYEEMVKISDADTKQEVLELEALNAELYESKMKELGEKQDAALEAKMLHVNTHVLKERTQMQREDAKAFILRELQNTWVAELQDLQTAQEQEVSQQLSIAKQAYETKYNEIVSNLEAEYADAMSKAESNKRESRKRRSSGGFMSGWFSPSPSKKSRGEGGRAHSTPLSGEHGSEEEDDEMDSEVESS